MIDFIKESLRLKSSKKFEKFEKISDFLQKVHLAEKVVDFIKESLRF